MIDLTTWQEFILGISLGNFFGTCIALAILSKKYRKLELLLKEKKVK